MTDPRAVPLQGKRIVLGVGGGIAAYKAAELLRLFTKAGADVRVAMTRAATEFVTPLTFQTLSGHAVATELFDLTQESEIGHIQLADQTDLIVIAVLALAPPPANPLMKKPDRCSNRPKASPECACRPVQVSRDG